MSSGVLDQSNLPEFFSIDKPVNLKWKTALPGLGLSSPVIWDDRLFITTAVGKTDKEGIKIGIYGDGLPVPDSSVHDWKVICLNKNTGKVIWERTAYTGIPKIKRHPKSTHANASVATDGKYVAAFFGSEGLYCYDFNGKLIWKKDFGTLKSVAYDFPAAEWEFASSPVIYNGILIVQCDVLENSFLATFDLKTGKEIWKIHRDDYPGWCTPNVYKNANKTIIAVNGYKHRGGYDLETGEEIWRMSGGGDVPIPTPVIGKGLIYFNSAHGPSSPILAVKTNATGDLTLKPDSRTSEFVAWSIPRGGSYIHSLLLYRDRVYNVNWNGTIQCYNAFTGNEIYRAKVGANKSFIASPVAADGRIYIVDEEGTVYVISDGDSFKLLSEIPLGEICLTAPSITDGIIFFRTQKSLIAFGKR
jgi:outer membrane protein assembly factor BamB